MSHSRRLVDVDTAQNYSSSPGRSLQFNSTRYVAALGSVRAKARPRLRAPRTQPQYHDKRRHSAHNPMYVSHMTSGRLRHSPIGFPERPNATRPPAVPRHSQVLTILSRILHGAFFGMRVASLKSSRSQRSRELFVPAAYPQSPECKFDSLFRSQTTNSMAVIVPSLLLPVACSRDQRSSLIS